MGVVIGFAAVKVNSEIIFDKKLIRLVPLLCLPFALMIHRHNLIIRYIGTHVKRELNSFLGQSDDAFPRHWDNSVVLRESLFWFVLREVLIYQVMQVAVPLGCLIYLLELGNFSRADVLWIVAGSISLVAVLAIGVADAIHSYQTRKAQTTPIQSSPAACS